MHILVVNDDGPPSTHASPYVHSLVRQLQASGHLVSVCLPHTQRSWIGKAHLIGKTVKPTYYRPPPPPANPAGLVFPEAPESVGTIHRWPATRQPPEQGKEGEEAPAPPEEWVLVDGTPASCVQIGLHHMFSERGPVDLILSGPNYGRNTTALFALSSGTLGGALEGASCRVRSVALSFAFFTGRGNHDPAIVAAACRHSVRVVEALVRQWPADGSVDLYSVNVPLVEGVEAHKTLWAGMLQNYWIEGGCFTEVEGSVGDEEEEEERIREGVSGEADDGGGDQGGGGDKTPASSTAGRTGHAHIGLSHKHFKWQPRFTDVYRSVDEAPAGNDGWVVREGHTSVTPLKASFWHAAEHLHTQELQLTPPHEKYASAENLAVRLVAGGGSSSSSTHESPSGVVEKGDKHAKSDTTKKITTTIPDPDSQTTTTAGDIPASVEAQQQQHQSHSPPGSVSATTAVNKDQDKLYALIEYDDPYVQPMILSALRALLPPEKYVLLSPPPPRGRDSKGDNGEPISLAKLLPSIALGQEAAVVTGSGNSSSDSKKTTSRLKLLQITPYEAIDFEYASSAQPGTVLVNSYVFRKALIRKHFLSATVDFWLAKHPGSVLGRHVKQATAFEVDYAEFLDDALVEAWDLRASLERNEELELRASTTFSGDGDEDGEESAGDSANDFANDVVVVDSTSPSGRDGESTTANATAAPATATAAAAAADEGGGCDDGSGGRSEVISPADGGSERGRQDGGAKEVGKEKEKEWWILKPSMSDRGQGIRLFSTMEELQGIFDEWEADMPPDSEEQDEDEDEDEDEAEGGSDDVATGNTTTTTEGGRETTSSQENTKETTGYITTAHLRHFVAQPYIHPPLLVPGYEGRKFHIRTYVLCIGSLKVYVYRQMLALFAGRPYKSPSAGAEELGAHLTNTCLQTKAKDDVTTTSPDAGEGGEIIVRKFWDLPDILPPSKNNNNKSIVITKESIFSQICAVTGEVFEAAARGMMMHFQPLPHAFEVYGLDFLVDAGGTAWLLEVNAFPDFKQTGEELGGLVAELWKGVLRLAVGPFLGVEQREEEGDMVLVRDIDLGRGRWAASA